MARKLLAIFGGGIHMVNGVLGPTSDFEIWPIGKRSLTRQPFNDDDPNSVCAMSELLLEAGVTYYREVKPDAVAIAYGESIPQGENAIMSRLFQERVPEAHIEIFDRADWEAEGRNFSGTYDEAANLLRLFRRDGFDELLILARGFHARAHAFTAIRLRDPEFADLKGRISIIPTTVEDVLLQHRPGEFDERIATIRNSRSLVRSLLRECNALMNFNKGITSTTPKPLAEIAGTAK
jgi:hypothetical protein